METILSLIALIIIINLIELVEFISGMLVFLGCFDLEEKNIF